MTLIESHAITTALSFCSLRIWGSNQTYKSRPEIACFSVQLSSHANPWTLPSHSLHPDSMSLPPTVVSSSSSRISWTTSLGSSSSWWGSLGLTTLKKISCSASGGCLWLLVQYHFQSSNIFSVFFYNYESVNHTMHFNTEGPCFVQQVGSNLSSTHTKAWSPPMKAARSPSII